MPIYLVKQGETERLIDAPNAAAAIRHYAKPLISAEVASTPDLFRLAKAGADVETVGAAPIAKLPVAGKPLVDLGNVKEVTLLTVATPAAITSPVANGSATSTAPVDAADALAKAEALEAMAGALVDGSGAALSNGWLAQAGGKA